MRSAVLVALVALAGAGCENKTSDALVLAKEHIAAREVTDSPAPESETPLDDVEAKERALAPDEIVVDAYVMKAVDRGTGRDPRAMIDEQWLIRVRTASDNREFNVPTRREQYERVKEGDQVRVRYRVGKYTKTVWAARLD